jgi:hypothetical protein
MNIQTKQLILGAVIALNSASVILAVEPSINAPTGHQSQTTPQWTLSTGDTELIVSISNNKIFIHSLRNTAQNWNWTPMASEVPFPGAVVLGVGRRPEDHNRSMKKGETT